MTNKAKSKHSIILNIKYYYIINKESRGFGFVVYKNIESFNEVLRHPFHLIDGKQVECKPATPKELMGKLIFLNTTLNFKYILKILLF